MTDHLDFQPPSNKKKTEKKRDLVTINLAEEWSYKDRMEWLIKGAQLSVDEIIKSLHQPMELETLRDMSYKNATSGREEAIITARDILMNVGVMKKALEKTTESDSGLENKKEFNAGFAEDFANKNKK